MNNNIIEIQAAESKWDILPIEHPTCIRRLCRELNYRSAGFYYDGERYTQARLSKGELQIRAFGEGPWLTVKPDGYFGDGNGSNIIASRTRCGH